MDSEGSLCDHGGEIGRSVKVYVKFLVQVEFTLKNGQEVKGMFCQISLAVNLLKP